MRASDLVRRPMPGVQVGILATLAAAFAGFAGFANDYQLHVMTMALVNVMLAVSLNWVMGYLGQLTLANASVFGVGAYGTAILMDRLGMPYPVAIASAIVAGGGVNGLFALPALRLKGFFLAIGTLTFGVFAHWSFVHGGSLTGGASGLALRKPDFSAFGLDAGIGMVLVALAGAFGAIVVTSRLVASPFGRGALCIAEQELIAPTLGIDVVRHKLSVFVLSGAIAGGAGAIFAGLLGLVDPDSFNLGQMIVQFMMVVMGGLASILGSVAGALLVTGLSESLRAFSGWYEVALGGLMLGIILLAPEGLYRLASRRWPAMSEVRWGGHALRGATASPAAEANVASAAPPAREPGGPLALRVASVCKSFSGLRAVDDVSFEVEAGSIHGLIGPNGSGKSTMLNLISRTTRLDTGTIAMFGDDVTRRPAYGNAAIGVGRTFQNLQLVGGLTVLENVMLGADAGRARRTAPIPGQERDPEARVAGIALRYLRFVGMAEFSLRKGHELSGGQMRLVEIARALASEPRLLLLDEPAAGLSLNRIDTIRHLILRINRELGVTVVLVEHVLNLVLEVSDRVTVLNAGTVLARGTPDEIRSDPAVQSAYLGRRMTQTAAA